MKFKTRVQVLLGVCILLIIVIAYFFNNFQEEFQKDPSDFILKNERLYKKEFFYKFVNDTTNSKIQYVSKKQHPVERSIRVTNHKKQNFRVAAMVGLQINAKLQEMNFTKDPNHRKVVENILAEHQSEIYPQTQSRDLAHLPWKIAENWVNEKEIHPHNSVGLGYVLQSLATRKVLKAEVPNKGSQLKLMLTLDGNQTVIFKPMRLSRDHVVKENPYAGPDRHNGEIIAFHLNRLLGFRRVPITVGRKINLSKEVIPVASQSLLRTFSYSASEGTTCFYGVCYYCRPSDQACTDSTGMMEGAVILWLPKKEKFTLKKLRNPWRRTYKKNTTARWETEVNYCQRVLKAAPFIKYDSLLLDIIDISIFDYLIGNADRHTLELFALSTLPSLIFIDNGKSFGNPYWDELTIIAPLYQCCQIRQRTYEKLLLFVDSLASAVDEISKVDSLYPLLTNPHLEALDRRLRIVLTAIELCVEKHLKNNVFK